MIKLFPLAALLILVACDRQSSPEGRSIMRDDQLRAEINGLKARDSALLDSLVVFRKELEMLRQSR